MDPSNLIDFPAPACRFTIAAPAHTSVPDLLVPFYERAVCSPVLTDDNRREFTELFRNGRTVRRAALDENGSPLGLALGVPLASLRDLGNALNVDRADAHVDTVIQREKAWALLVSVAPSASRHGIAKGLANAALAGMRQYPCTRVFVAVRVGADHWLHVLLLRDGFSRDGMTKDGKRVLLSRKADGLAF